VTPIDHNGLHALLRERAGLSEDEAAALAHALDDIQESAQKIYGEILPKIMACASLEPPAFRELLDDIGDEFRHIAYHIEDSQLTSS